MAVTSALAIGTAALTLAACGGATRPPTILNTEKIERAIEQSSLDQRGTRAHVSCPSGVHQRKGLTFSCSAVARHQTTRFVVTQTNGSGQVHYVAP